MQSRSQRPRSLWSATGQCRCEVAFSVTIAFSCGQQKNDSKNHRSTKIKNPETESRKRKRNTESNINDRKLKNFTLRNLVQSKENLF